jgi:hypothetical protein
MEETTLAPQTTVPVHVLFGFDHSIAAELEGHWDMEVEAITIFYGGNSSEVASLKKWWMEKVEPADGWPNKILIVGGSQEDPTFAVDFVSTLAFIRPKSTFSLNVMCRQCTGFPERTSQKLKLRRFVNRVEALKCPNLHLERTREKVTEN